MEFRINKGYKRIVIMGAIGIVAVSSILLVKTSLARYNATKNLNIASGTINYKVPDFKMIAMYKNDGSGDTPITEMPELGYEINTTKSYCTTDNINKVYDKMYTDENGQHVITGLSKDDKCYLYFDKQTTKNVNTPLGIIKVNLESPDSFTGLATTDEGVFEAQDDDGVTYYWRGAVTNNYVKFSKWSEDAPDAYIGYNTSTSTSFKEYSSLEACQSASSYNVNCTKISRAGKDMYWRIIRINGDGTIRLIYDGTSARANGTSSSVTQIGTSAFNSSRNDNKYVGFKYTSNDAHGTGEESKILGTLNTWYNNNLDKTGIKDKIDGNAGFCNDREPYTDASGTTSGGGTGTTTTYYGAYIRFHNDGRWGTTQKPTFKCKDSRDLFTKSGATKKDGTTANGNRSLKYPVGLITADEVVYAGGFGGKTNSSYYLYTGQAYWTLSPGYGRTAYGFYVGSHGDLDWYYVTDKFGVRPVINLKADTKFTYKSETTKGTASDPYVVDTSN